MARHNGYSRGDWQRRRRYFSAAINHTLPNFIHELPTLPFDPTCNHYMSLNPEAEEYTPWQEQGPSQPLILSQEGVVFSYEPYLLGHSTDQTEHSEQASNYPDSAVNCPDSAVNYSDSAFDQRPTDTDPFWHQYPSWVHNKLYYYPEFGFVDYPIYANFEMDGSTTFIGYKTQDGKRFIPKDSPRSEYQETVAVYLGNDEFVQNMPLRLLRRFSFVAKEQFPFTAKNSRAKISPQPNKNAEDRNDSGLDSSSAGDIDSRPGITASPSDSAGQSKSFKSMPKSLHLHLANVDASDYPRVQYVKAALDWMKSNKGENNTDKLLDYGPEKPSKFTLLDLLEIYQVAVALAIQPMSTVSTLKSELRDRVSHAVPEEVLDVLRDITTYLPVDDPVTVRAITAAWDRWSDGVYTADEWLAIKAFLLDSDNEALAERAKGIFNHRMKAKRDRMEKQHDRAAEAHQAGWRRLVENSEQNLVTEEDSVRRRRNRRAQQQRGKELEQA